MLNLRPEMVNRNAFWLPMCEINSHHNRYLHPIAFPLTLSQPMVAGSVLTSFDTSRPLARNTNRKKLLFESCSRISRKLSVHTERLVRYETVKVTHPHKRALMTKLWWFRRVTQQCDTHNSSPTSCQNATSSSIKGTKEKLLSVQKVQWVLRAE